MFEWKLKSPSIPSRLQRKWRRDAHVTFPLHAFWGTQCSGGPLGLWTLWAVQINSVRGGPDKFDFPIYWARN